MYNRSYIALVYSQLNPNNLFRLDAQVERRNLFTSAVSIILYLFASTS